MKRIFDFSASLIGLAILIPLFFIIMILVKVSSKGPIFFRQQRIGKGGKPFYLFKFRSMKINETDINSEFEPGVRSRVTFIGRYLRVSKLDELPQLFNVLKGDMSLVGPRPEVQEWTEIYPDRWKKVLTVRPGITDNASIEFRMEELMLDNTLDPKNVYQTEILPKKLDFYEDYVLNRSFMEDLFLILKSIYYLLIKR